MVMPVTNSDKLAVAIDQADDPQEFYAQVSRGISPPRYDIFTPDTTLAPSKGNNEGYYIQWYKNKELYSNDIFYMSCKFYNAKTGEDIRMVNKEPSVTNSVPNLFPPA